MFEDQAIQLHGFALRDISQQQSRDQAYINAILSELENIKKRLDKLEDGEF
jgi:hypothetical protein